MAEAIIPLNFQKRGEHDDGKKLNKSKNFTWSSNFTNATEKDKNKRCSTKYNQTIEHVILEKKERFEMKKETSAKGL